MGQKKLLEDYNVFLNKASTAKPSSQCVIA